MPSVERWISGVSAEFCEPVANEFTHRKRHAKVTGLRVTRQRCPWESCSELWNRKAGNFYDPTREMLKSWQLPTAASNVFCLFGRNGRNKSHAKVTIFRAVLADPVLIRARSKPHG